MSEVVPSWWCSWSAAARDARLRLRRSERAAWQVVTEDREAANQAVKSGVLRQLACGFLYGDDGKPVVYDDARLNHILAWCDDLKGRPGLIFYEFVELGDQLREFVPKNILLAQINSMSHGVEGLQKTYHDCLFAAPVWSRDQREQAVGRVWRQGSTAEVVNVTTLVCDDTLDDVVLARVAGNARWMELFKQHLGE